LAINLNEEVEKSLCRIIILKTFSKEQLQFNFSLVEKLLFQMSDVSLIVVDAISTFYWQDAVKYKCIRKMDLYLKDLVEQLKIHLRNNQVASIIVKPGDFDFFGLFVNFSSVATTPMFS